MGYQKLKRIACVVLICWISIPVCGEELASEILGKAKKRWEETHKELKSYIAEGVKIIRTLDKSGKIKEEATERFRLYVKGNSSKYDMLERSGDTLLSMYVGMDENLHTFLPSELLEENGKCDKLSEDTLGGAKVYVIEGTSKSQAKTTTTNAEGAPKSAKETDIIGKIKCWIDKDSYMLLKTELNLAKRLMLVVKFSLKTETLFKEVNGFWLPGREFTKMEVTIPIKGTQKQETETIYEHYDINVAIPDSIFKKGGENVTDKQSE